ncbi:MAG: hydroxyisourate hydrolase [Candidatus Marinimicrobia bacterium]|jgi:5-hydroxyisourate hydrolase|nr:hydroxyisourate hydrolase [Candidatus Neomarinimicrobiota bacterium]MBT3839797.1 hydroxyisourate hydrolase [Candidatus Neomarinimicrobiota bacterium]MBT3999562.1 hydroxyisourate hydrolase [Candidatus Neomarinimicrobiota bacterium]MBT4283383.1 hydroxyisourate hydrolase [Candidatus Neomarinimicrobiota bacterium]MBT4578918.1 hydroxyisourate hydrolase [Candidatus Neomarinimicrobiota bacterium]
MRCKITTHVLDLVQGLPANNIPAILEKLDESNTWKTIGNGTTNDDGRIDNLVRESDSILQGSYRLTFDVSSHFESNGFYSSIPIIFNITDTNRHYHIPLLLSRFGYSTYRGS